MKGHFSMLATSASASTPTPTSTCGPLMRARLTFAAALAALLLRRGAAADEGWVSLFDGKTLAGWKASEAPGSFRVVDGAIACDGPRSHLFYVGADGKAAFENFEATVEVNARKPAPTPASTSTRPSRRRTGRPRASRSRSTTRRSGTATTSSSR